MISADQPTCFPRNVRVAVSSREDGTMLDRTRNSRHHPEIVAHRQDFCRTAGLDYSRCVYQIISYEADSSFATIIDVAAPTADGVQADVVYTETPGVGLFLPIADCIGTVLYDQTRAALALAHLGRHASVAKTMSKTIEHFVQKGSNPADLLIWMSPSIAKEQYGLAYFDDATATDWEQFVMRKEGKIHLDLAGFNKALAVHAGVPDANIFVSPVTTATDPNYFSHSQGDSNARFAVVAQLL